MPNEKEIAIIQKAAMFDLIQIIKNSRTKHIRRLSWKR